MGRSKGSCLKIIACGSDSAVNEDTHQAPETKGSSDKRGWSFRKRSASHRVLSNTAETPSPLNNKEITEVVTTDLQTQPKETFAEKPSSVTWSDETPQQAAVITKEIDTTPVAIEKEKVIDVNPDESVITVIQAAPESVITVIQAATRGFLARRQILRVKSVVKLQAAVRGHLVRRHAVGTLRCVQAIVKMQGLVRARQARISSEAKPLDKETSSTKPQTGYISIEKLLGNKFAHQLLESTPKTKPINIKCDTSSRSGSAWNWLERWMLVSSKTPLESPSDGCEPTDAKTDNIQTESDDVDTAEAVISDTLTSKDILPESVTEETKTPDLVSEQVESEMEPNLVSSKPEVEIEQVAKSAKRSAPEEVESEGKRFAFGSRKATNPAFIAVQSKFNELSHKSNTEAAVSSSVLNDVSHTSAVKVVGDSECGTELSVTSTLDSPDRSDAKVADAELETELKKEVSGDSNSFKDLGDETKADPDSDISNSVSVLEKLDDVNGTDEAKAEPESAVPVTTAVSEVEEPKMDTKESNEQTTEVDDQQASAKSSSPKRQTIVPESQETPSSSQVSMTAKKTNRDKSSSKKKTKSSSAEKSSPSNPNQKSLSKNSFDVFPKELKTSKRRKSFGSADQEPRDSSSSSSLPSYMQATESARAKALANSSPRSSPDVLEKDGYLKKRHSLPGANGKQGSPRFQPSKPEANQGSKGNGHSQESGKDEDVVK